MALLASAFDLPAGRLLALDLGQARTGVAVCDELGLLATPLTVLRRRATRAADFAEIAALVQRERAVGVLMGLPVNAPRGDAADADDEGAQARWARRYGGRLARALPVPAAFWDETFSTVEAARLAAERGARGAGGRKEIDALAAAVILSDFLEARRARGPA
ncbi:MAG: putative Holliday junction resolvase [Chloroflexi bacterium ADurb.Bin325]|nr:MAG: putative Holliday junction resolvase [Chloroflexi bacterium ADurb.Bin325]